MWRQCIGGRRHWYGQEGGRGGTDRTEETVDATLPPLVLWLLSVKRRRAPAGELVGLSFVFGQLGLRVKVLTRPILQLAPGLKHEPRLLVLGLPSCWNGGQWYIAAGGSYFGIFYGLG